MAPKRCAGRLHYSMCADEMNPRVARQRAEPDAPLMTTTVLTNVKTAGGRAPVSDTPRPVSTTEHINVPPGRRYARGPEEFELGNDGVDHRRGYRNRCCFSELYRSGAPGRISSLPRRTT